MTINSFFPPVHIHPILIIFIMISFVTGTFLHLLIILTIVLIHELGHYTAARFFKWHINGITLWVFGGVMDTDEHGNKPVYEDVLVTLAGPLQHAFVYFILYLNTFESLSIMSSSIWETVFFYNTLILVFNLLPIWPLDGGKLIFYVLSQFAPFKKAFNLVLITSIAACILFICGQVYLFSFNLSAFLVMLFLLKENHLEWKKRYYFFIRFLLKRYQGDSSIQKVSPISVPHHTLLMDVFARFYRGKKHSIYVVFPDKSRRVLDENDCLRSYFYDKQVHVEMGDLFTYRP